MRHAAETKTGCNRSWCRLLVAHGQGGDVSPVEAEAAEIDIKYAGFIRRQVCTVVWPLSNVMRLHVAPSFITWACVQTPSHRALISRHAWHAATASVLADVMF